MHDFLKTETIEVECKLIERVLGTVPMDKDVYAQFIASKSKDEQKMLEEVDSVPEEVEKNNAGWTTFMKDDDGIFIYNYMILGNIKANLELIQTNKAVPKIQAYRKWADRMIEIYPRKVRFEDEDGFLSEPSGNIERPLRGSTPKGERITVTRSDYVEVGTKFKFKVELINNVSLKMDHIIKSLSCGEIYGIGQWRGSGSFGRYIAKVL